MLHYIKKYPEILEEANTISHSPQTLVCKNNAKHYILFW